MHRINKELIDKILELKKIYRDIKVVVDYKKEEVYIDLKEEIVEAINDISNEFTPNDIKSIIDAIYKDNLEEYYIYDKDELIEVLFPDCLKRNIIIKSAYQWIESNQKIEWVLNNVLTNKDDYNCCNNINDNYIITTKKLELFKIF